MAKMGKARKAVGLALIVLILAVAGTFTVFKILFPVNGFCKIGIL